MARQDVVVRASGSRPSGAGYVRYEDTYVTGDSFQATLNRVTAGNIITLPPGEFVFRDFARGYIDGVRVGSGGATGCGGIVGSGRQTVLKMAPGTSTHSGDVPTGQGTTNPCYLITVGSLTDPVLKNFALWGTDQGHYYGGIMLDTCTAPVLEDLYLRGASPGYANYNPGETFGINVYNSPSATLRRCEVDGRDETNTPVCASPVGWNATSDANIEGGYFHHALTGMVTFWHVAGVTTHDVRSEYNGTGGAELSGDALNHEGCTGAIRHYSPTLKPAYNVAGNHGLHIALNSSVSNNADCQIIDPTFDPGPGNGCLAVGIYDGYSGQLQTSLPTVTKGGATLTPLDSGSAGGAQPAVNYVRYH